MDGELDDQSCLVEIYRAARERNVIAFVDCPESRLLLCVMLAQYFSGDPVPGKHESIPKFISKKKVLLLVPSTPLVEEKSNSLRNITDLKVGSYLSRTDSSGTLWNFKNWQNEVRDKQVLVMTPTILATFIERQLILLGRDISSVMMYECNKYISLAANLFNGAAQIDADGVQQGPFIFGLSKSPSLQNYVSGDITPVNLALLQNNLDCELMAPEGCVNYLRLASQIKVDERLVVYDEKKSGVRAVSESHADFCSQQLKRLAELQTKLTEAAKSELAKSAKEMSEVSLNMRCSLGDWCAGRTVRAYVDAMAAKEGLEIAAVDSGQSEAIDLTELCGFPHVLCRVLEALRALLAESSDKQALIFVCSSYEAKAISDFLNATSQSITGGDIKSACITSIGQTALKSNNSQSKAALAQQAILDRFRQGAINVLVSSSMLPHQLSLPYCDMVILMRPAENSVEYLDARLRLKDESSHLLVFVEQTDFTGLQSVARYKLVLQEIRRYLEESELQVSFLKSAIDDQSFARSLLQLAVDGNGNDLNVTDEKHGICIDLSNAEEAANECFANTKYGNLPQYLDAFPYRRCLIPLGIAKEIHLPAGSPLSMKSLLGPVCLTRKLAIKSAALLLCRTLQEANILVSLLPESSMMKYQSVDMFLNPDDRQLLLEYDDGVLTTVSTYEKIVPRWLALDEDWKSFFPVAGNRHDLRHTFDWIQSASPCSVHQYPPGADDSLQRSRMAIASSDDKKLFAVRLNVQLPTDQGVEGYVDKNFSFIVLSAKLLPTLMPIQVFVGEEKIECQVKLEQFPLPDMDAEQMELVRDFDTKFFGWMMRDQVQSGQPVYSHTTEPVMNFFKLLPIVRRENAGLERWEIEWDLVRKVCRYQPSKHTLLGFLKNQLDVDEISSDFFTSVITGDQRRKIDESLRDIVLCTPFNKMRYQPSRLKMDLFPTSTMILDGDEQQGTGSGGDKSKQQSQDQPMTYEQYFMEHRQLTIENKHVPLVEAQHALWFKNFLSTHSRRRNKRHIDLYLHLIPELCQLLPMSCAQYKFGLLLPSILHRLENFLTVEEFRTRHPQLILGLTQSVNLYTAFCAPCAGENVDYDRLEIFGDSFLKLACSTDAFRRHPNVNEGLLSMLRVRMVCNKRLYNAGTRLNLQDHIIATPFYPRQWSPPEIIPWRPLRKNENTKEDLKMFHEMRVLSDKMIADVLEALIGAYYLDGGVNAAMNLLYYFRIIESKLPPPTPKLHKKSFTKKPNLQALQDRINYHFHDINLLVEAFTHSSAATHEMPSYQRLEYLGDAVLDFLITRYLMERFTTSSPGELTDLRTAAVNNSSFGRVSIHNGLHKFVIHDSKVVADEIRQYVTWYEAQDDRHEIAPHELEREGPKLLGDIFESLCGAIFVDLGYNVEEMWGIVAPMVAPFIDEHCISESVNKHPIRRFHEKCRKLGVSHEEILFKVVEEENTAHCTISIRGKFISSATGNAKSVAKRLAAVAALEVLAIGLDPPHAKRKRADNGSISQATSLSSTPTKEYERATKKVKTSDNKIQTVTNSDGILSNVVHADGASNDKNDTNDDSEDKAEDGELPTVHPGDNESNSEEIPSIQTGDEEEGELFVMQDYCDRDVKIEVDDGQIAVEQDMDVSNQQGSDDEKSELSNKHENRDEKVSGDCDNEEDGELCNTQATEEEGEL